VFCQKAQNSSWPKSNTFGLGSLAGCSRFNRWAKHGLWTAMLEHFASNADMESVMIDATHIRAHSSAAANGQEGVFEV
jgi:transposase